MHALVLSVWILLGEANVDGPDAHAQIASLAPDRPIARLAMVAPDVDIANLLVTFDDGAHFATGGVDSLDMPGGPRTVSSFELEATGHDRVQIWGLPADDAPPAGNLLFRRDAPGKSGTLTVRLVDRYDHITITTSDPLITITDVRAGGHAVALGPEGRVAAIDGRDLFPPVSAAEGRRGSIDGDGVRTITVRYANRGAHAPTIDIIATGAAPPPAPRR